VLDKIEKELERRRRASIARKKKGNGSGGDREFASAEKLQTV